MLDQLKSPLRPWVRKMREAVRYSQLGDSFFDRFRLAIVGYHHIPEFTDNFGPLSSCLLGRRGRVVVRPKIIHGKSVTLDVADWAQVEIFHEIFALGVYDLSLVPFIPEVVIDCGGHIGLFTVLASSVYPAAAYRIYEPNGANLELINIQVENNKLGVQVFAMAVSNYNGECWFTIPASPGGRLEAVASTPGDRLCVCVVDLCRQMQEIRPQKLLLKMDIEGEEAKLLPALIPLLPRETVLFFETHDSEVTWDRLARQLGDSGFKVTLTRQRDPYRDGVAVRYA